MIRYVSKTGARLSTLGDLRKLARARMCNGPPACAGLLAEDSLEHLPDDRGLTQALVARLAFACSRCGTMTDADDLVADMERQHA